MKTRLSDVLEGNSSIEYMTWGASVPAGVNPDKIYFDEKVFTQTRRMAGVDEVFFMPSDERTDVTVQGSMNPDGSLTSAKAAVSTTPKGEVHDDSNLGINIDEKSNLSVFVNNQEILKSLTASDSDTTYTQHFVNEVSKNYRSSIFSASIESNAVKQLKILPKINNRLSEIPDDMLEERSVKAVKILSRGLGSVLAGLVVWSTYDTSHEIVELAIGNDKEDAALDLLTSVAIGNGLAQLFSRGSDMPLAEKKWSAFNYLGLKLDRVAISGIQRVSAKPVLSTVA